eukprot:TRINITY_DN12125_c0_g2_i4.p1 TRINITY_DN12125_c0_g2~~TRINITY_DN12125_c0_g2_i4.p1  ORF type:complete len:944 (-),score=121.45 TRINITY_DN12125_c0_g2_i4:52-2883(-)
MLKAPGGGYAIMGRMPATPCGRPAGAEMTGGPATHGGEGRTYLVRAPLMPMLTLSTEDKPIIFRPFRNPTGGDVQGLKGKTLGARKRFTEGEGFAPRIYREDVAAPAQIQTDAPAQRLVLWTPPPEDVEGRTEVVVDPALTKVLREHQRLGVQFLFDCLMGVRSFNGCGCILADDMGLGKTLQSVSILWTLLTQGGPRGRAACRKALVVCPASLVKNWAGEIDKWLDKRCKYIAVAASGAAQVSATFASFRHSREHKVLIASYETFRGHAAEVKDCGIDLVVCDEAHKLKNDESAVTKCIASLDAKRRLLISGTPIQNNLDEFFTLVSVANPGVFGDAAAFRKSYGAPILRGREPTATDEERRYGTERLAAISEITEQFILRRTNRLNARFLPPKQLFNVFVEPTDFQLRLYRSFLRSNIAQKLLCEQNVKMTRTVLSTIKKLQSLVNHPLLVRSPTQRIEAGFDDDDARLLFEEIDRQDKGLRSNQRPVHEELSGKFLLLYQLLVAIRESKSGDRVVIISNWTQTLDLVEKMCEQNKWPLHRLDGTMAITKRMKLVNDFNRAENPNAFAFLLSSKAGGCGLNLIGANRLVMFDPDWNPANDRQAMARCWRDGQKKPCFIYRLFTKGTIDEKVYQRQICKDGLSTMMVTETGEVEQSDLKESLAADLVKDLFSLSEDTPCATHDMLGCSRCGSSSFVGQLDPVVEDDLNTWSHHLGVENVPDEILIDASRRMQAASRCAAKHPIKVSFTMGCHIEYTPEQIARLEAEEREGQRRREEAVLASKAAVEDKGAVPAGDAVVKPACKSSEHGSGAPAEEKCTANVTKDQQCHSARKQNATFVATNAERMPLRIVDVDDACGAGEGRHVSRRAEQRSQGVPSHVKGGAAGRTCSAANSAATAAATPAASASTTVASACGAREFDHAASPREAPRKWRRLSAVTSAGP